MWHTMQKGGFDSPTDKCVNLIVWLFPSPQGQSYEDKRCKCVCPSPAAVLNNTAGSDRKLYIANVPPNKW